MSLKEKFYFEIGIVVKSMFLLVLMLDAIPFLYEKYGGYVKIFLVFCLLYLAAGFLIGRNTLKSRYMVLLLLFSGAYLITIIVNRESYLSENMKQLVYMVMIFLLFYGYDTKNDIRKEIIELRMITAVYEAVAFLFACVCLFTYFLRIDLTYFLGESQLQIGMFDNRLWGLYNPNTGAGLAMAALYISLYNILREDRPVCIILHVISLIVETVVLILSGSRAPLVLTYVGMLYMAGVSFMKNKRAWEKEAKKSSFRCFVSVILIFTCFFMVKTILADLPGKIISHESVHAVREQCIQSWSEYLGIEKKVEKAAEDNIKLKEKVDLTRKEKEEERPGGILTGRTDLWESGMRSFFRHPLWGVGREGVYDACEPFLENKTWQGSLYYGGLHNIFLTVLVSSGLVGMMIMSIFLILIFILVFRSIFLREIQFKIPEFNLCLVFFLSMGCVEMLEARILYRIGIFVPLFWMFTGWLACICDLEGQEKSSA